MRMGHVILRAIIFAGLISCGDFNYYSPTNHIHATDIDEVKLSIDEEDWELADSQVQSVLDEHPDDREANMLLIKIIFGKAGGDLFQILLEAGFNQKANGGELAIFDIISHLPKMSDDDRTRLTMAILALRGQSQVEIKGAKVTSAQIAAYAQLTKVASALKASAFDQNGKFNREIAEQQITPVLADQVISDLRQVGDGFKDSGDILKAAAVNKALDNITDDSGAGNKDKLLDYIQAKSSQLP